MTSDPSHVELLFLSATEFADPLARKAFLDRECGGDTELRQRVEALLSGSDPTQAYVEGQSEPDIETSANSPGTANSSELLAGRYRLIKTVGQGGMGTVWLAEQLIPVKRQVAVKLIKDGSNSSAVLSRFAAERQALAMMDHPNIARMFDGGLTPDDRPFFVMEYVAGVPITEYCDQARLPIETRVELFITICQAVQHAHQKGIIHRDLKPSNILVCMVDGKPVPKVIDFGLAKAMHQPLTDSSLHTAFGVMLGTPLYMSPEQAEPHCTDVDTRTDIYSLGVILYELLTGSTPLEIQQLKRAAYNEVLRLIKETDPLRPSARVSSSLRLPNIAAMRSVEPRKLPLSLKGDLDWIVMKVLEKERNRRYETANGLARELQRYLSGEPVEAGPPSNSYRLKKLLWRNKGRVLAAGLVALSLLGGAVTVMIVQARANSDLRTVNTKLDDTVKDLEKSNAQLTEQRTRAEENELQAIAAVKAFGNAVVNNRELKSSPSLDSLRKTLMRAPLEFFKQLRDRLQADGSVNPESLERLAEANLGLARIASEIGNRQDSLVLFEEAFSVFQTLLDKNPADAGLRAEIAAVYNNIGNVHRETGNPDDALQAYAKALTMIQALTDESPNDTRFARLQASVHNNLGAVLSDNGKTGQAIDSFDRAIGVLMRLGDIAPQENEIQSELARSYKGIGVIQSRNGNVTEAVAAMEKAFEICQRLAESNPTDDDFQTDLAASYSSLGILYSESGKIADAFTALQKGLEIIERIAKEHPTIIDYQIELAANCNNIGLLYRKSGKPGDAIEYLEKSVKIVGKLLNDNPASIHFRNGLAMGFSNIGDVHLENGNFGKALEAYQRVQSITEPLAIENPSNPEFQTNLASNHNRIGLIHRSSNRYVEARASFEEARRICEKCVSEHTAITKAQCELARSYSNIGVINRLEGKQDEALAAYQRSLDIQERLVREHPAIQDFQTDLAGSYNNVANLYQSIGKPSEALAGHEQARQIRERLLNANPSNVDLGSNLATSYRNIANVHEKTGNPDDAVRALEEARRIFEQMARENPGAPALAREVGGTLDDIGVVELGAKRFESARDRLLQAVDWQKRALSINPGDSLARLYLENHLKLLVNVARELGRDDRTKEVILTRRVISFAEPEQLAWAKLQHGFALDRAGQTEQAAAVIAEGLDLRRRDATAVAPGAGGDARGNRLAEFLTDYGTHEMGMGRYESASKQFGEAIVIYSTLLSASPSSEMSHELCVAHDKLAQCLKLSDRDSRQPIDRK